MPGLVNEVSTGASSRQVEFAARFTAEHAFEDARLVRRAQRGDETAFEALYERYARVVHGILLARVPRIDVDDLVQDVFLSAWQRLDTLRDPAAFGGWLAMITRNRATDSRRRSVEVDELPQTLAGARAMAAPKAAPMH
jgi:RNA polymerase sigma-70 factor (ECF subfamily)